MYKKLSSHVLSFTSSFSLFFPTSQPNFWKTHMLFLVLSHFLLNLLNSFYSPYFINMVAPHVKCLLFAKSSGHLRFIFWFLGKPHTPGLSATSSPLLDSDEIPFLCYAVNTNPLGSLLSPLFLLYIHQTISSAALTTINILKNYVRNFTPLEQISLLLQAYKSNCLLFISSYIFYSLMGYSILKYI